MAASHYTPGQTIFSNLASGFQGAENSEVGSEKLAAGQLAARQAGLPSSSGREQTLARVKEAIPLLTALQTQQRLAAISKLPSLPAHKAARRAPASPRAAAMAHLPPAPMRSPWPASKAPAGIRLRRRTAPGSS